MEALPQGVQMMRIMENRMNTTMDNEMEAGASTEGFWVYINVILGYIGDYIGFILGVYWGHIGDYMGLFYEDCTAGRKKLQQDFGAFYAVVA